MPDDVVTAVIEWAFVAVFVTLSLSLIALIVAHVAATIKGE